MPAKVLAENWSDYDDKKKRGGSDANNFACTESWEVDYLKNKIKKVYPQYSDALILNAISKCCEELRAPHPRKAFVECVMKRLRV